MEWEEAFHALSVTQWLLATKATFLIEVMPWMITRELKGGVTVGSGGVPHVANVALYSP